MTLAVYCLLGDLMDEMQVTDPNEEPRVDRAIIDASRAVDAFCKQEPGAFAAQTLTKTFDVRRDRRPGRGGGLGLADWYGFSDPFGFAWETPGFFWGTTRHVFVPPLLSVTTLSTDSDGDGVFETTWTSGTDYYLWPRNEEVKRRIDVNTVTSNNVLPVGQERVKIVGSWGITEDGVTPYGVRRATLLLAMNYYRRPSSQLNSNGLGGAAIHFGYIDPDVASLLWSVSGKYRVGWTA